MSIAASASNRSVSTASTPTQQNLDEIEAMRARFEKKFAFAPEIVKEKPLSRSAENLLDDVAFVLRYLDRHPSIEDNIRDALTASAGEIINAQNRNIKELEI